MKNENENNAQEQMQEQICSYLFGELEAKDKAHVEQRFEESEVWRAERDRLQGTIGLVQAAMKADTAVETESEQLSEAAMQSLALAGTKAAASHGGAQPTAGASPMRIFVPVAATVAVALGGFLAFQKMHADPEINSESTARVDDTLLNYTSPTEEADGSAALIGGDMSAADGSNISISETEVGGVDAKRPIFNIKHTGEITVSQNLPYAPGLGSKADVQRKLDIIAKNMPRSGDLPHEHLMIRGGRSVPFKQVQQVMQNAAQATKQNLAAKNGKFEAEINMLDERGVGGAGSAWYNDPIPEAVLKAAEGKPYTRAFSTGGKEVAAGEPVNFDAEIMDAGNAGGGKGGTGKFLADSANQPAAGRKRLKTAPTSKSGSIGKGGGAYRGPGDSTPPRGGAVMPSPPSASGPSTPGPAASSAGRVALGLDVKGKSPLTKSQRDALSGQGSSGGQHEAGELASELGRTQDLGAFYADAEDDEFRGRMEQLYERQQDENLKRGVEVLAQVSSETEDEFKARVVELAKQLAEQEAKAKEEQASGQGQPSEAPAVDRFAKDKANYETPEQLEFRLRLAIAERAKLRHERLIHSCIPKPNERPNAMYYRWWGDNPFVYTSSDKQATFAADVDTASYALARRYLTGGNLPTREQVRTEEFVNYFAGDIPAPAEDVFAVQTEMTRSPFGGTNNRYMLRVGIRGKVIPKENRPPMALVFVVDTSGSMSNGNRMDLVKHSLRLLGTELDGRDQVGVVSFSSEARLVLPMTSMDKRGDLESAVQSLSPDGSTNVEDGIRLGYELLSRVPADGRLRRVVLISDGVANTGSTVADEILKSVKMHRENGINLSTVGVGMGNHNDALLERLANRGDGICDYVDDADAARRAMVERFSGGFIPIARDLKIQLEFTNSGVLRYRQIGYENRAVADADFRNDAVDGGEVGSGHQVTALFELECVDMPDAGVMSHIDFGQVRLRYKSIATGSDQQVFETEHALRVQAGPFPFERASSGFARSVVAAQFAEVLRRSTHAAGDDYAALVAQATRIANLPEFAGDGETQELAGMIRRAGSLGAGAPVHRDELWTTVNSYRKHRYLCGSERELSGGKLNSERLAQIAAINADLEARIRELSLREALQGR